MQDDFGRTTGLTSRVIAALAAENGAFEEELMHLDPDFKAHLHALVPLGLQAVRMSSPAGVFYRLEAFPQPPKGESEIEAPEVPASIAEARMAILVAGTKRAFEDGSIPLGGPAGPQAPPVIASPAEAPATPRPEKPPVDVRPLHFLRTIRVTDFRISAGGGRTKIVATPADTASAGAALELSGLDTGVLILEISVEGESAVPTEPQPAKRERSAKEIAAEIAEQEKQGLPGSLASAMGNLLGRG